MGVDSDIAKLQVMWDLCLSAARHIYATRAPKASYAYRVARQLFGTGAHESDGFFFNRQIKFEFRSGKGGHGYWQQQMGAILDCVNRLQENDALALNAAQWLFETEDPNPAWFSYLMFSETTVGQSLLLQLTCTNPRISCMWARLYYMRDPDPIPFAAKDQAAYWGRVYNTRNEAEKNEKWERDYWHFMNKLGLSKTDRGVEK